MKNDLEERKEVIEKLTEEIKNCKKYSLWRTRKNPVIDEGPLNSEIMFIGEAPGYNEDLQGKPFVGKAAGFMTYISVEELIPAAQIKQNLKLGIVSLILGAICVLLISLLD